MGVAIRNARPADAADMAVLMDMAGHGLPAWLWSRMRPETDACSVLEVRRWRAMSGTGSFSWRNAVMAESEGVVAGMAMGFTQPDRFDTGPDEVEPVFVPLVELEALTASTWYLNAIAVYAENRKQGVGSALLAACAERAAAAGHDAITLIAEDTNRTARKFYADLGFELLARRPFVAFPGSSGAKEWILLIRRGI